MATQKPLVGVYPGTFDPITKGHLDIIRRATRMTDRLVIGVAVNAGKGPLFSVDERVAMVRAQVDEHLASVADSIAVEPFSHLLMDFVCDMGATLIVRGLRAVSDFEYEFQMAGMNAYLNAHVETVFLMASDRYQLIASRLVKEIAKHGGDVSAFVPPAVAEALKTRYGMGRQRPPAGEPNGD
ncbi:MAG: pantetheine-phosphate adenylyltransferase [Rhodobacterales bacterium]|nr:pantetheine-phosphate adenylyltransferase [Rhodobacterales bacterium]